MNKNKSLKQQQIKNIIQKGVTLVDFNAPWCAPCRTQKPILHQLAKAYHGKASVVDLNVDEHRESAMAFGIASIPTLIVFKDGKEVERFVGLQNTEVLSNAIEKALV